MWLKWQTLIVQNDSKKADTLKYVMPACANTYGYLCMYMHNCTEINGWQQVSHSHFKPIKARENWQKCILPWETTGVLFKGKNRLLIWQHLFLATWLHCSNLYI